MDERTRQECRKIRNRRTGWKPKSFQPVLEPHAKIKLLRINLLQRFHHEITLLHQWMRDLEIGLIYHQVIYHQDIDVDDAVMVFASHRLHGAPHFALYALRSLQHLARRDRKSTRL